MPLSPSGPQRYQVLFLDFLITAMVISAVFAALLPDVPVTTFKARFVNVLYAMSDERNTLIERHAHTGVWTEPQIRTDGQGAQVSKPNIDYRIGTGDGSVVAAGTLWGRPFRLHLRPAVADPASQWSVLWLCGARQPPAGWTAAGTGRIETAEELLPSICRTVKQR